MHRTHHAAAPQPDGDSDGTCCQRPARMLYIDAATVHCTPLKDPSTFSVGLNLDLAGLISSSGWNSKINFVTKF
jgi:hypothetical protein